MSYALGQTAAQAPSKAPPIDVGRSAGRDVFLARASLLASRILYEMVGQPDSARSVFLRRRLLPYGGPAAFKKFQRLRQSLLRKKNPNQATYDALRLVIVNHVATEFKERMHAATAVSREASVLGDLNETERDVACGVTGGVTLLTGLIGSIYGGEGGAAAAGTGGSVAATAFDCNKDQRESAERIAAAQAQAAQAQANAAMQAEQARAAAAAEKTKQIKTVAVVGGLAILLLGGGYLILQA